MRLQNIEGDYQYSCEYEQIDLFFISFLRNYVKAPKIVIDLKTMIYFNMGNLHTGLGGTYFLQTRYLKSFLDRLKKLKAEMIFFSQQREIEDVKMLIPRAEATYISGINVLDSIIQNNLCLDENEKNEISAPATFHYNLIRMCQQFGEVRFTYNKHNQEMAKYLQNNPEAFAIFTNDSDFAVFDGDFQFWLVDDLNMKDMTTTHINRPKLLKYLGLNRKQMQLLSTLSNRNVFPYEILSPFYIRIGSPRFTRLVFYVRNKNMIDKNEKDPRESYDLDEITSDVFGDQYTEYERNGIENGLTKYDLNYELEEPENEFEVKLKDNYPFMYKLIDDEILLLIDYKYIDFRLYQPKTYTELVMPLLKRMQGILCSNHTWKPESRFICAKFKHDEPFKVVSEQIEYPPCKKICDAFEALINHPLIICFIDKVRSLDDLIFSINYKSLDVIRWRLLKWMLELDDCFTITLKQITVSNKKLIPVMLTLRYLLQVSQKG